MDATDLLTELNVRIGDSDDFSFTSDEKTSALTEAMNDESVVSPVWDSSLTFDYSTYQYARPATIDVVSDIYIKRGNSNENKPEKIASDLWEVVDDNLQFKNAANAFIPDGYTLYLKGVNKYTSSDTINETNVQEYILALAEYRLLEMFGTKKAIKFINNDSSLAEIVTQKREAERRVERYRRRLPRQFENA